ncbi:MAG: hypothetical protein ACK5JT_02395 [Hyphomicrobiaceae bacterium]
MKQVLKPGSFGWLVAHDLRLNWRRFLGMFGRSSSTMAIGLAVAGVLGLHLVAWPMVPRIAPMLDVSAGGDARLAIGAFLICVVSWMAAQGLFQATRTLYDRGDLDLLLGSPLQPRKVFAAKALAVALSSLGSVAMLALPVANVGVVRYGAHWLAFYPTLASLALIGTAFALLATTVLFYTFGPRKARLYAQFGGAFIGGAFVLGVQIIALLPDDVRNGLTEWLGSAGGKGVSASGAGIAHLPVDALLGDPVAVTVLTLAAVVLFAGAIRLLGDRFARMCLEAAGMPSGGRRRATQRAARFGVSATRSLRLKEWRLLVRDPSLFTQLGLQIIYTIPLAVVLVKSGSLPIAVALTPAIVVISAQVAASLAWIVVSGEDAPELIATAPIKPDRVDAAKLSAIAVPVALVAAVPIAGLAMISTRAAVVTLLLAAGASIYTSLLNLWHPMPGNRRGMLRRHSQSKFIGLMEHLLAILWAIAAVLVLFGTLLFLIPIGLATLVLCNGQLLDRVNARMEQRRRQRRAKAGMVSSAT